MTRKTRHQTLYRLIGVEPVIDGVFDALDAAKLDAINAEVVPKEIGGVPALVIHGSFDLDVASWAHDASTTAGMPLPYGDHTGAVLILLVIDGHVYAVGFGAGHRLIPSELKDHRFGLSLAVRCLDPAKVKGLVRRELGGSRTDSTLTPAGSPIWMLGIEEYTDVVRRIGGQARGFTLNSRAGGKRPMRLEGGTGVSARFGVYGHDLVRNIRELARICAEEPPDPELAFAERIQPVTGKQLKARLDAELDDLLGCPDGFAHQIGPAVPTTCLADYDAARAFVVKVGSVALNPRPALEVAEILQRARLQLPGQRVETLRTGRVFLYADEKCQAALDDAPAINWLEVTISLGEYRYFLLDGAWYEIGAEYVNSQRRKIATLFRAEPSLALPSYDPGRDEDDFNAEVAMSCPGFVNLHRTFVRNPLSRRGPVEVCDILGPGNELLMVKFPWSAESLSHLFMQGLVSVKTLLSSAEARRKFAENARTNGRQIPDDFVPEKVVFVVLLKSGRELTPDTLFPFAQVTLAHIATVLRNHKIDVEVIGIKPSIALPQVA
ncbi:DUF6119 family protein [Nonomuraea turkmeniaca]|nr:DUF6119 family protein [Nonomuraea turkmeniaca]